MVQGPSILTFRHFASGNFGHYWPFFDIFGYFYPCLDILGIFFLPPLATIGYFWKIKTQPCPSRRKHAGDFCQLHGQHHPPPKSFQSFISFLSHFGTRLDIFRDLKIFRDFFEFQDPTLAGGGRVVKVGVCPFMNINIHYTCILTPHGDDICVCNEFFV